MFKRLSRKKKKDSSTSLRDSGGDAKGAAVPYLEPETGEAVPVHQSAAPPPGPGPGSGKPKGGSICVSSIRKGLKVYGCGYLLDPMPITTN